MCLQGMVTFECGCRQPFFDPCERCYQDDQPCPNPGMENDHEHRPCPDCGGPPTLKTKRMVHTDTLSRSDVGLGRLDSPVDHLDKAVGHSVTVVACMDETGRFNTTVDLSDSVLDRLASVVGYTDAVVGRTDTVVGCSARVDRSGSVAVHLDGQDHLNTALARSSEAAAYSRGTEARSDDRGHLIGMMGYTGREGHMESTNRTDQAPEVQREHRSKRSWSTFAVAMAVNEATMAWHERKYSLTFYHLLRRAFHYHVFLRSCATVFSCVIQNSQLQTVLGVLHPKPSVQA